MGALDPLLYHLKYKIVFFNAYLDSMDVKLKSLMVYYHEMLIPANFVFAML